jgi:thiol-disulfide isomerase/thioredoxin
LWHSGLMADLFAGTYQLVANNKDTAHVAQRIDRLSDAWIAGLSANPARQQEVAEYCFKMLEQQNRTAASEHIALAMLDQTACQLDAKRTNLFEQYRKMAIGNTAPDIVLQNGKSLSAIAATYKLVVFGASWCPNCQRDYPSLVGAYKRIKGKYDVEFVYVSLDTDKKVFGEFFKEAPFSVYCDWKGWESDPVKAYYMVATPTYFLLDSDLKIVAKPKTPEEAMEYIKKK